MVQESYYDFETDTLVSQLAAVRESGATNMINVVGVESVAEQCDFDELAEFCRESDAAEYSAVLREMGERR